MEGREVEEFSFSPMTLKIYFNFYSFSHLPNSTSEIFLPIFLVIEYELIMLEILYMHQTFVSEFERENSSTVFSAVI